MVVCRVQVDPTWQGDVSWSLKPAHIYEGDAGHGSGAVRLTDFVSFHGGMQCVHMQKTD